MRFQEMMIWKIQAKAINVEDYKVVDEGSHEEKKIIKEKEIKYIFVNDMEEEREVRTIDWLLR